MDLITWSLLVAGLVLIAYYLLAPLTYWQKRGIPCAKGVNPVFGHLGPVFRMKKRLPDIVQDTYESNRDSSMVGMFSLRTPQLLVREPALVKTVMQTNFHSFQANGFEIDPSLDPLISANPFFKTGEEWVTSRKGLTYAFTGMRLKVLFHSVLGVTKKLDNYLKRKLGSNDKYETELKDLFSRYTGEVVANAGMGVEGFCFDDNPSTTSFHTIGKDFFDPDRRGGVLQGILALAPQLNKIFRQSFIPKNVDRFFRDIVRDVFENRKKESVPRNDFFQLMLEMEKTEGEKLDMNMLTAQSLSFFADGYETSSITLSFVAHHLAVYPEVQEKLRKEIKTVMAKYAGALTYEGLKEMTYMDQVISESQRFFPVSGLLNKRCTQEFELKGSDGLCCKVKPGTDILICISGMQMDPKYWPNPENFDPDRFSEERRKDIERFTFLAFGEGPRQCVGMRMALLQMKACLASVLNDYSFELSPKTQLPLKLSIRHFLTAPEGGLWAYVKRL